MPSTLLKEIAAQAARARGMDPSFLDLPLSEQRALVEEHFGCPLQFSTLNGPPLTRDQIEQELNTALRD